jgi:hypothetical protein
MLRKIIKDKDETIFFLTVSDSILVNHITQQAD